MSDDAHDLMPESIAKTVPKLYATQHETDPLVRVKWFTPDSSWTWYVTYAVHGINHVMPRV